MKLIVGLGNPGKEYENTRHNIGFMTLDSYLPDVKWSEKFKALYYEKVINNEKVLFIKPLTYMNLSGDAVYKYVDYYDIAIQDILVIQDDMDLEVGSYKLKKNSSSGGHNGIKSIIAALGSEEFARLKIGIAHNKSMDTKDYVLGRFKEEEREIINNNLPTFNKIIDSFISDGIEKTMNIYNTK